MKTVGGRTFNIAEVEILIRNDQMKRLVKKASLEVKQAMKTLEKFWHEHKEGIL